ncbi:MAG: radical SAM/SPASM domain-containing protein [Burkholderiales bacterium]|nr:radical SAM/SPASM domain-containing protein [Burkholderiales bacterium]
MLGGLLAKLFRNRDARAARPHFDPAELGRLLSAKARQLRDDGFLDYPALVHLETRAVCNAACGFCPYERLERKGSVMPDALIEKVIDDLTAIPPSVRFQLAPYKVSDPLLEPRLADILALVNARLPHASISIITNGSAFTEAKIAALERVHNLGYISVSLNSVDPGEYERLMALSLAHTLECMRLLQRASREARIRCPVRVTRVSQDGQSDRHFRAWVKENFPEFAAAIIPRNDWIGQVGGSADTGTVSDLPCHRWFDLSITASGIVAMCCMDADASFPKGDVRVEHALTIYNRPFLRELRRSLPRRGATGAPCNECTYLSY